MRILTAFSIKSGEILLSASTGKTNSPRASSKPKLRAADTPRLGCL